jgi:hypothetical protein
LIDPILSGRGARIHPHRGQTRIHGLARGSEWTLCHTHIVAAGSDIPEGAGSVNPPLFGAFSRV